MTGSDFERIMFWVTGVMNFRCKVEAEMNAETSFEAG